SQRFAVFGFFIGFAEQFRFKHVEVIGNGQTDLALRPVFAGLGLWLLRLFLDDRKAEPAQDKVRLSWRFTAAELFVPQYAANRIATCYPDNRLWRVSLFVVDQKVAGGLAKWVIDSGVEIGQRLKNVFTGQTCWN